MPPELCPATAMQGWDVQCPVLPVSPRDRTSVPLLIAGAASCFVLGFVTGAVATFGHQSTWSILGLTPPVGLVAGLAGVACLVAGLRIALGSRVTAACAAFGVVTAITLLALPGPSGSALLPANPAGFVWTVGPTVISAIILAWPRTLGRRHDSGSAPVRWDTDGGEERRL